MDMLAKIFVYVFADNWQIFGTKKPLYIKKAARYNDDASFVTGQTLKPVGARVFQLSSNN